MHWSPSIEPLVTVSSNPAADLIAGKRDACRHRQGGKGARRGARPARPGARGARRAFLDRIASEYDPPINAFALPSQSSAPSRDDFMPYHLTPLLASLPPFRTLLHEKLAAAYRTLPASVTDDDRATGARTRAERRMKLERAEEALVLAATGLCRRPDVDPLVVLTTILAEAR